MPGPKPPTTPTVTPTNCATNCTNCPTFSTAANTNISNPGPSIQAQGKAIYTALFQAIWADLSQKAQLNMASKWAFFLNNLGEGYLPQLAAAKLNTSAETFAQIAPQISSAVMCAIPDLLTNDPEYNNGNGCGCNSGLAEYNFFKDILGPVGSKLTGAAGWAVSQACLGGQAWPSWDIVKPKKCPDGFKTIGSGSCASTCVVTGCFFMEQADKTKSITTIGKYISVLTALKNVIKTGIDFHKTDKTKVNANPMWRARKDGTPNNNWTQFSGQDICFSLLLTAKGSIADQAKQAIDSFKAQTTSSELENIVDSFYSANKSQIDTFCNNVQNACYANPCTPQNGKIPCSTVTQKYQPYSARDVWSYIHTALGTSSPFPSSYNDILGYSSKWWNQSTVDQAQQAVETILRNFYENCLAKEEYLYNFISNLLVTLQVMKGKYQSFAARCDCYSFSKCVGKEKAETLPCCNPINPDGSPCFVYHGCNIPVVKLLQTTVSCPWKTCDWSPQVYGEDSAGSSSTPKTLTMWANDIAAGGYVLGGGYTATPSW